MSVELSTVKALREARTHEDDWTGLTNPVERRRRQNRLHQRAWRRRQAQNATGVPRQPASKEQVELESKERLGSTSADILKASEPDGQGILEEHLVISRLSPVVPFERLQPFSYWERLMTRSESLDLPRVSYSHKPSSSLPAKERRFPPVFPYLDSHPDGTTIPTIIFPLSADHRLIVLVQLNVLRGMLSNLAMLRLIDRLPTECGAVLYAKDFPPPPEVLPPSLQETWFQQNTPHDPWLDMFPCPRMRDNILSYQRFVDGDDFCEDLMGGLFEGYDDVAVNGLLLWGEPWSETGWEITEGFAKKWGFLLQGCDTLIKATNSYREARGEDRLVVEVN